MLSTTVQQAYEIDKKIDDGLPQSGSVLALSPFGWGSGMDYIWAGTAIFNSPTPYTTATAGSDTTCFDNGNVVGTQHYSTEMNNGMGVNCALSFRFQ